MSLEQIRGDGLTLAVRRRPATGNRGLLLLHGWPGNHRDWASVFDALSAHGRWDSIDLLSPDLRGFGASDRPSLSPAAEQPWAAHGRAEHVKDLVAVIDELGLAEVIIGSYDLGANLAQALARIDPRVRGLVLCDPVHPAARARAAKMDLAAELWYQHFHVQPWAADLVALDRRTVEIYLRHFYTHWWGEGAVSEVHFQALVDDYARPGAFEASIAWYRARAGARAGETSAAMAAGPLKTPAVVLWGEADPVTPVLFADSLSQSFGDCELLRLPGVGHFGPLEAPHEVAGALTRLARRLGWIEQDW